MELEGQNLQTERRWHKGTWSCVFEQRFPKPLPAAVRTVWAKSANSSPGVPTPPLPMESSPHRCFYGLLRNTTQYHPRGPGGVCTAECLPFQVQDFSPRSVSCVTNSHSLLGPAVAPSPSMSPGLDDPSYFISKSELKTLRKSV